MTRAERLKLSNQLRVLLDAEIFVTQRRGGIRNYFQSLVEYLPQTVGLEVKVQLPVALVQGDARTLPCNVLSVPLQYLGVKWRLRLLRITNLAASAALYLMRQPAVKHSTYYNRPLKRSRRIKQVVTVHDMIPEKFPEWFPSGSPHGHKMQHLEMADLVLCVSETTRRDLFRATTLDPRKVRVTPLAASPSYQPITSADSFDNYVLFVGQRDGYKNFPLFARMARDLRLHKVRGLVVGPEWTHDEQAEYADLIQAQQLVRVDASDEELRNAYDRAIAFVYPSRYEGFGIPVLEAMQSGCPCILSSIDVFHEVAGEAAHFIDPADESSATAFALHLRDDKTLRELVIQRGFLRSRQYSSRRTAQLTADAYHEAVLRG